MAKLEIGKDLCFVMKFMNCQISRSLRNHSPFLWQVGHGKFEAGHFKALNHLIAIAILELLHILLVGHGGAG